MIKKDIPQLTAQQQRRFWSKVDRTGECWKWVGCLNKTRRNYGVFGINGKLYQAHRVAFFLHHNVDPSQLYVCHRCDNTGCVNPNHLFLGTPADNVADRDRKHRGKFPQGERNRHAKLTDCDILAIRNKYALGQTQKSIGDEYNVDHSTIGRITRKASWAHIN